MKDLREPEGSDLHNLQKTVTARIKTTTEPPRETWRPQGFINIF